VRLATHTGLLVASESRPGRIRVVAVDPHAPGLDGPAHAIGPRPVAGPDPGAQAVERVVGDLECLRFVAERRHCQDRPEDLLLEYAHLVMATEDGRLE